MLDGEIKMKKKLGREIVEQIFNVKHDDYELIDKGIWVLDGKYEYCNRIFQDQDGDYWKAIADRSGSSSSDWRYQYDTKIIQVEQKEVIVIKWKPIEEQIDIL